MNQWNVCVCLFVFLLALEITVAVYIVSWMILIILSGQIVNVWLILKFHFIDIPCSLDGQILLDDLFSGEICEPICIAKLGGNRDYIGTEVLI